MARQRSAAPQSYVLRATSTATPERLFGLISDAPKWPTWFRPARHVDWHPPGSTPGPGGAGAVRRVRIGPFAILEAVVAETAPTHHAYSIRSVLPVREHRADVWFRPQATGTAIEWRVSFHPKLPGTGRLLRAGLRLGVSRMLASLIRAAER